MASPRTNESPHATEPTRITATQLARSLSDILNRVRYRGERFEIQRNGETVAMLGPTAAMRKGATLREYLEARKRGPRMDEEFLKELEQINADQPPPQVREWPD